MLLHNKSMPKKFLKVFKTRGGSRDKALTSAKDEVPATFLSFFILGGMLFGFEEMHTRCLRKSFNENDLI